jgi:hypothetical protein
VALLIIALLIGLQNALQSSLPLENYLRLDSISSLELIISIPIVVTGIILIISAWLEVMRVRIPLICELLKVNEICQPSKCERYKQYMKHAKTNSKNPG